MHLNIFVSQKCFVYCKGCYSFSRIEKCGQFVPTCEIIEFLNYVYKKGVNRVTLCGGDPLTRPDILDLLKQVKDIGYYISLDTVGTSIIKEFENNGKILVNKIDAKELVKVVDEIGIPIDGSSNDIFRLFRGTDSNILEEQIKICEELHKYGANICINTVVHKGNLCDFNELGNLIKKLYYINKWQLFQFAPLGKFGMLNKEFFEITKEEFDNFKFKILNKFIDDDRVQFKSNLERDKCYMLIDNSGNAWIQNYDEETFNNSDEKIEERRIIGNITNFEDWDTICSYLII